MATVVFAAFFITSCSGIKIPFISNDKEGPKLEGLKPIASSGLSTTKDVRVDVVELLMEENDIKTLKRHIEELKSGAEANWTNKDTGNVFTVRAIESVSRGESDSRKVVVWGRRKGDTRTMVKTYRYYF